MGKDLAEVSAGAFPATEELTQVLVALTDGKKLPQTGDPELISRAIMERILSAETFEDAFAPQELDSWSDYMGLPVQVTGIRFHNSTFDKGSTVYAVCDLERLDGEIPSGLTVTCGGRNVLAQLVWLLQHRELDKPVKMQSKPTAEGFNVLWLVPA